MNAFVFEHPDRPTSRKRRPHVIVACDKCRSKKLKCLIPQGGPPCENCAHANIECTFVDRERDLADRENAILDAYLTSKAQAGSSRDASVSSTEPTASTRSPLSQVTAGTSNIGVAAGTTVPAAPPVALFAPGQGLDEPNPALMSNFIEIFFAAHGRAFRFMSYERVVSDYLHSALPAPVANLLAALAMPHCESTFGSTDTDRQQAAAEYAEKARIHIYTQWATPSISTIQALVLMAGYESMNGNINAAHTYITRAYEMGIAINLGDDAVVNIHTEDTGERERLHILWDIIRPRGQYQAQHNVW